MKNWLWIPLAAVIGVIAGSWGPREDLEAFKAKMQEERATRKSSASAGFDAFAKLANIPDVAKRRPATPRAATNEVAAAATNASETPATTNATAAAKPHGHPRHLSPEDLRARIDEATELWRTRVDLAMSQWKAKLDIGEGPGSADFDSAIANMNEALRESMQALADEIESAGKVTPELGLRLMGDASRVMAEAYDAIGAAVPEGMRGEVSEIPVFEFIDPSVAEPLIGVQDKLETGFGEMRR